MNTCRFSVLDAQGPSRIPRNVTCETGETALYLLSHDAGSTDSFRSLLFAQIELLDHTPVAFDLPVLEIIQKLSPASHELQQTSAGSVVSLVNLKVLREKSDPFG
jgi:hypothetical protein